MSGFEVVGVVLGAIPLLISGLEHYAEGIRTMKTMWNYEAVVNHLVVEFRLSQSIYRHSCEDLLMPILPDIEAAKLLEGESPIWNDPVLDKQLCERLGTDYDVYTRYVRNLRRRIEHFSRKLGLDQVTMSVSYDVQLRPFLTALDFNLATLDIECWSGQRTSGQVLSPYVATHKRRV